MHSDGKIKHNIGVSLRKT